jgi:hypothetical protein
MEKVQDRAVGAVLTGPSFDVTIYIYVGIALGRLLKNSGSRNTSDRRKQ